MDELGRMYKRDYENAIGKILESQIIQNRVEREKKALILNRNQVREKVETTEKTEKVNDAVSEWLNDVDKLVEVAEIYVNHEEILNKLSTLNTKCKFESFSNPIPGLEHFSSSDFVCFETTKVTSDELLNALKDDRSHIIGLYGTSGSGKTTLAKAVAEKAKYLNIFDAVLFATMSQNSTVQIRDQLAESLNLRLEKGEFGRARKIYSTLERMGSVLVILDDVRKELDFEDISIPCNGNRCKILLTTRYQQLCKLMNCHRKIPLQTLSEEEACILLKKYSGIGDESSSRLIEMAKNVALKCNRSPSTIKDIGSSLRGKPIKEWEASLHCLGHSRARYHVFLSFRGIDTRYSFVGFLNRTLRQEGFKTFMDEDGLEGGNQISQSLTEAIKASRLSIIVFSKNFPYSSWCLEELVTILECMKEKHQEVLPIFYKVEPTDVRHQKNIYGEAMIYQQEKLGIDPEKVMRWRSALFEVANLSGMHYSTGYEYEFIQMIIERVNNMKNRLSVQSMDMD